MSTSTTTQSESPSLDRDDEPHHEASGLRRLSAEVVHIGTTQTVFGSGRRDADITRPAALRAEEQAAEIRARIVADLLRAEGLADSG